jgi:hypothetical protein
MAEKTADANMKGARDTIAQDLKARGVYGSGAEVVQNMMSQSNEANRRYMANMAADAQAQQRAMQALGAGSDLAGKMRASETQEGSLANQVNMFNNQMNQGTVNARSAAEQAGRTIDNAERNKMATTTFQGTKSNNASTRGDIGSEIGTQTGLTQGKIANTTAGMQGLNTFDQGIIDQGNTKKAGLVSDETTPLFGGGIG